MAQLTDDCFAFGGPLMTVAEALAVLRERVTTVVEAETVPLAAALGRILAEDVIAAANVPPCDNSAVDGYAVFHADVAGNEPVRLPVTGRAAAGHPLGRGGARGEAVRIFTGAAMPGGFDTVMMQEDCTDERDYVVIRPGIRKGANRRRAGEDIAAGTTVLSAGGRLRPQDVAIAAAAGRASLKVFRPLKVAVVSTGDELVEPGRPLPPGAIYDSNRYGLIALLSALGCDVDDLGILADDFATIRDGLAAAAGGRDLVVTSGGMSVGEEDHVKAAVRSLGSLHFWQLAIKPGRPVGLGQIGGVPFIGLPGNPAAMMVTFFRIARPMIRCLAGGRAEPPRLYPVAAGFAHKKKAGRREYVRVRIVDGPDGGPVAERFPREGAGILSSMVAADGLAELPEDLTRIEPGQRVDFLPFFAVDR